MLEDFFASLNTVIPLYEEASFRKLYDRHYSADPPTSAEWYASLNTVLAIGSLMAGQKEEAKEIMPNTDDISQNVSWRYFRNACSVFTDLLFKSRNLLAVQALIGMVRPSLNRSFELLTSSGFCSGLVSRRRGSIYPYRYRCPA